jgi:hypothetical protein
LVNFYQITRRYNPEDSHLRTVVFRLQMLHFQSGAVAAQRLAVAIKHEEPFLCARTIGETATRRPLFVWPWCNWIGEKIGHIG